VNVFTRLLAAFVALLVACAVLAIATASGTQSRLADGTKGSGCMKVHEQLRGRTIVHTRICIPDIGLR
jgi:hypothetical protein